MSTRRAHPKQHLHERAGRGQHQHQQLFHQVVTIQINISVNELHQQHQHQERRCPRPSSCYWRRFGQLKQTWRPRQSWSGGSQGSSCLVLCWLLEGRCKPGKEGPGGDGGQRWGCSASTFKIFKLGGRSSQEQSLSLFQI